LGIGDEPQLPPEVLDLVSFRWIPGFGFGLSQRPKPR
jgi:hypothetical protein